MLLKDKAAIATVVPAVWGGLSPSAWLEDDALRSSPTFWIKKARKQ